ncbi:hypothetical protein GOB07_13580, partial [Sinorhizobium meliloti]|nr:hypothetical protein [Sinorhizobium meliloti]
KKLHTSRTPTPDAFRWGRHHLGIRGRLFLGIGGRDHFGIRGRIASEFACWHFKRRFVRHDNAGHPVPFAHQSAPGVHVRKRNARILQARSRLRGGFSKWPHQTTAILKLGSSQGDGA